MSNIMNSKKIISLIGISLLVFIISFLLRYTVPAFETLELKALDWRFDFRGVEEVDDAPIVIVSIDDYSFEVLPERWPWPRSYYAHVIRNLNRAGARVIGMDLILDVPDRRGKKSDALLAKTLRETGNVVLAGKLEISSRMRSYQFLVEPIPELKEAADNRVGLVSIEVDPDGIYRRYPVVQPHQDSLLPSIAVELLRKYQNLPRDELLKYEENHIRFGEWKIPLYQKSTMLIDFAGPRGTFPMYSFASIIDDENFDLGEDDLNYFTEHLLPEEVFKDKIVLIGSTVAELHDNFPTPFLEYNGTTQEMPGVEIHANALRTILNGLFFKTPSLWWTILMVIVLIFLLQWVSFRSSTTFAIIFTVALILVYNITQFVLFSKFRMVMDVVFPTLGIFFSFVANTLYQYVLIQKEKKKILGAFQQYVPEKVINELLAHPEKLTLGGEERVLTVLFSDVANFTTISESLSPRDLVMLINDYLSEMTNIILKHNGIIDKYEGDAIMAEFGAPVYFENHAQMACLAALEMQKRLKELSRRWRREGKPVLTCRVGINTGNMIVGNMGSHKVFDYTVLGDEVNLASRLEGANKAYGTRIMISEATYNIIKDDFITRPLDMIRVKGKHKPVQVYELIAKKGDEVREDFLNILPIFTTGIQYYQTRNWEKAGECFRYCLKLRPEDGPSKLYLKRVLHFSKNPPPENWDGVYEFQSK
ncbi:MAG: adenylate/guanylate cyclase domain-containing protein [Calditrichaeota bacterium]|nr:MAG: adenylate/guanylate cyclase domain-containing protein [Calditrichota bacterium]